MLADFLLSVNEDELPMEFNVMDDKLECDEADRGGRDGDFLDKHTPPKAHKNPVILAHSFICSWCHKYPSFIYATTFHTCYIITSNSCSEF